MTPRTHTSNINILYWVPFMTWTNFLLIPFKKCAIDSLLGPQCLMVLSTYVVAHCPGLTVCTGVSSVKLWKSPLVFLLACAFFMSHFPEGIFVFSDLVCIQHLRAFLFGSYSFNEYLCLIICFLLVFSWSCYVLKELCCIYIVLIYSHY